MLPFSTDEPPQKLTQQNKTVESATGGDKSLPQSSRGSSAILFYFCDWIHHDRLTLAWLQAAIRLSGGYPGWITHILKCETSRAHKGCVTQTSAEPILCMLDTEKGTRIYTRALINMKLKRGIYTKHRTVINVCGDMLIR